MYIKGLRCNHGCNQAVTTPGQAVTAGHGVDIASDIDVAKARLLEIGGWMTAWRCPSGRPRGYISQMPEIIRDQADWYMAGGGGEAVETWPRPDSAQISQVERLEDWVRQWRDQQDRQIAWAKLVVHPVTGRNLISTRRIAKKIGVSNGTISMTWTKIAARAVNFFDF